MTANVDASSTRPAEPPLRLSGVTVSYPAGAERVTVIDDVSLELRHGETLGLVGESGSGKSMTALSVLRLHEYSGGRIDAGSIEFFGRDLVGLSPIEMTEVRGRRIAMIFQDALASLDPAFTVGQQLIRVLRAHRDLSRRAAKDRAVELLAEVGIPEPRRRIDQYPHQFSGGMCQRVMIAMALSCEPAVLLADEPTTALDVTTQAQIVELLHRLSDDHGMSTLFTTHDLSLVSEICDRVAVMYAGEVVEVGTIDQVFGHPRHPYTQALLDAAVEPSERGRFATIVGQAPTPADRPPGCRFHPRCPHATDVCRSTHPAMEASTGARCHYAGQLDLPGART
jgi:oligopeptide/dipeptide ABC transporter ATP-binding protein